MRFSSSLCYLALAVSVAWGCAGAKTETGGAGGNIGGGARGGTTGGGAIGGYTGAGNFSGTWTPATFPWSDPAITNPKFDGLGEDTAAVPELVYPLDGSMHPKSIRQITFHWRQGSTAYTQFRIRFEGTATKDMYVPCCSSNHTGCEPLCQYTMDETAWLTVAHELSASPPAPVTVTVTGSSGSKIGTSAAKTIYFTPEALVGGLYYWSTALPGIYRMNVQSNKAEPFVGPSGKAPGEVGTETNPLDCAGCHSVSRDGSTIAWTADTQANCESFGQLAVADTIDPNSKIIAPDKTINSTLPALNVDGSWAAVTYDVYSGNREAVYKEVNPKRFALWKMTRDAKGVRTTPTVTNEYAIPSTASDGLFGTNKFPSYPEWSPVWDGASNKGQIAVSMGQIGGWPASYGAATLQVSDIAVLDVEDGAITRSTTIVPGNQRCMTSGSQCYHAFPTWSPDGQWLAFVTFTANDPAGSDYYKTAGNPNGILRLVKASDPAQMYNLFNATQKTGNIGVSATWPKFSPFSMMNGDLMFITFSSKRDYGWALQQQTLTYGQCLIQAPNDPTNTIKKSCPGDPTCQKPQLWMAGIQLSRGSNGDPSYAPLWLPYQETNQWNHLAYWSESITCVPNPPTPDLACGENLVCLDNKCVSTLPIP